jgi:hypothetical protein
MVDTIHTGLLPNTMSGSGTSVGKITPDSLLVLARVSDTRKDGSPIPAASAILAESAYSDNSMKTFLVMVL